MAVVKRQILVGFYTISTAFCTFGLGSGVFPCLLPIAEYNVDNVGWKTHVLHSIGKLLWKLSTSTKCKRNPEKCVVLHNRM